MLFITVCLLIVLYSGMVLRKGFLKPTFKILMIKIPMNQNTNKPYQNTNGPYQNTNRHYQNTNNAYSKYQRRKFIMPTIKFIISKYQQPYQNTNRPYDHVHNTNSHTAQCSSLFQKNGQQTDYLIGTTQIISNKDHRQG